MKISEKQYQLKQLRTKHWRTAENQSGIGKSAGKGKTDQNEAIGKAAFEQSMDMGIRMSISTSTVRQAEQIFEEDVGMVYS